MIKRNDILFVSCDYIFPKGGIAQVVNDYSKLFVYFRHISSSKSGGNKFVKHLGSILSIIKYACVLFDHTVRIVHVHGASYNSFWRKRIYINIGKLFGKKIVYHIHGGAFDRFSEKNFKQVYKTLHKVDRIVVLTNSWKQYFMQTFNLVNVSVLPNPVDYRDPTSLKTNKGVVNLLFLGKICDDKGIFDLVNVFIEHQNYLKDKALLHIAGEGDIERLRKLIVDNNLEDFILLHGWVSGEVKKGLLSSSDIYILPSYIEGLPISILEAMSYSIPVLSTNVGGIPELINESNGILFNPGDRTAMYQAINLMLEDEKKRIELGNNGYISVIKHFPHELEKTLLELYDAILT